jgi:hypothetical protein
LLSENRTSESLDFVRNRELRFCAFAAAERMRWVLTSELRLRVFFFLFSVLLQQ